MSRLSGLAAIAVFPLVEGASRVLGERGAQHLTQTLTDHFVNAADRLPAALERAHDRAWQTLGYALGGGGFWSRVTGLFSPADQKAFADRLRVFLETVPLEDKDGLLTAEFRHACLGEWQAAQRGGYLKLGTLQPDVLARQAAQWAAYDSPAAVIEAELRTLQGLAEALPATGFTKLQSLLAMRPSRGRPLLAVAVRYYFRREILDDPRLAAEMSFARLEQIAEAQEAGLAALRETLSQHGGQLDALLSEMASLRDALAAAHETSQATHEIVRATHAGVVAAHQTGTQTHQAVRETQQALSETHGAVREIRDQLRELLASHQLAGRELRPTDSLMIQEGPERELVRGLLARWRQLPDHQRAADGEVLNDFGKAQVAVGDFDEARASFTAAAAAAPDTTAQATAHHNAYLAALEQCDYPAALVNLQAACRARPGQFEPFPFSRYSPQGILGAGGFAVTFLCHNSVGKPVVVKALRPDGLTRRVEDVFAEAAALEELDHPGIVRLRDCGFADDQTRRGPYLLMDYVAGATLESHITRHGPIAPDAWLAPARQICEALAAAHAVGLLHRDVKPANVLIRADTPSLSDTASPTVPAWRVKLIDFGLCQRYVAGGDAAQQPAEPPARHSALADEPARVVGRVTAVAGGLAGTLDYAAPEQLGKLPGVPVGPASDVYGFGRTCLFALLGSPDPDDDDKDRLPEGWRRLLRDCTARQVAKRPENFAEVLKRLAEIATAPMAKIPPSGGASSSRWSTAALTRLGQMAQTLVDTASHKLSQPAPHESSPHESSPLGRPAQIPDANPTPTGDALAAAVAADGQTCVAAMLAGTGGPTLKQLATARAAMWQAAAAANLPDGLWLWGRCLADGLAGCKADAVAAIKLLNTAAQAGHPPAQNSLAVALLSGEGLPADPSAAAQWLRRAADANFAPAHYNLALMLETGRGVAPDPARAAQWHLSAAQVGHSDAAYRLGCLLLAGKADPAMAPTGPAQRQSAAQWLTKAAAAGHAQAAAALRAHGWPVPTTL